MILVNAKPLSKIAEEIFKATGCSQEDAEYLADHVVTANLYGHDSHGVMRIRPYVERIRKGIIKPGSAFTVSSRKNTERKMEEVFVGLSIRICEAWRRNGRAVRVVILRHLPTIPWTAIPSRTDITA